tara:strand:- start:2024 stop:2410 length:387 start_codon:yes stop_codon:yes gene_type:complete
VTAYKVVQAISWEESELVSAMARGDAVVEYRRGRWAEPPEWLLEKGYGLLVFDTERQVRNWLSELRSYGLQLWEIEIEMVYGDLPIPLSAAEVGVGITAWPEGTMMADRVKLVRRLAGAGEKLGLGVV